MATRRKKTTKVTKKVSEVVTSPTTSTTVKKKRPATRRKRKKKVHYHTGTHSSTKCKKPVCYRSGWEQTVCEYLDNNVEVEEYWYETIKIPYLSPVHKKVRFYIPDFLVLFSDGSRKMVEVKRQNQLNNIWVMAKAEAARRWCAGQKPPITYEFWTDKLILPLQKAYKLSQHKKVEEKE